MNVYREQRISRAGSVQHAVSWPGSCASFLSYEDEKLALCVDFKTVVTIVGVMPEEFSGMIANVSWDVAVPLDTFQAFWVDRQWKWNRPAMASLCGGRNMSGHWYCCLACNRQVNSAGGCCRHHDIKDPKQDLAPCLGRDLPACLSSSLSTNRLKLSVPTQLLVDHRRGNFFRRHLPGHPERGFQAFNFRSGRNVSASQDLECQVQFRDPEYQIHVRSVMSRLCRTLYSPAVAAKRCRLGHQA